jgi:two-component system nitrogen regulation response regulator GlnG
MLGRTPAMQNVFKRIALAANSDAAVLLRGESGVGKEMAANAIHRNSARSGRPLVAVDAAMLESSGAEEILFGVAADGRGSSAKSGLAVQANGGTLFVDEIARMPLPLQMKLLRALEYGEVLPVGGDSPLRSRFRVISATKKDLRKLVEAGQFRHDLYFRLCTFEIELPPLRDRRDDMSLLADSFVVQFGGQSGSLAEETLVELESRPWYGNVRELRSAMEHAIVLARQGSVMPEHLPPALPNLWNSTVAASGHSPDDFSTAVSQIAKQLLSDPDTAGTLYDRFLQQVEPPLLATVMSKCGQRCAPAARVLGLHRTTLKKKLSQYEIEELVGEG